MINNSTRSRLLLPAPTSLPPLPPGFKQRPPQLPHGNQAKSKVDPIVAFCSLAENRLQAESQATPSNDKGKELFESSLATPATSVGPSGSSDDDCGASDAQSTPRHVTNDVDKPTHTLPVLKPQVVASDRAHNLVPTTRQRRAKGVPGGAAPRRRRTATKCPDAAADVLCTQSKTGEETTSLAVPGSKMCIERLHSKRSSPWLVSAVMFTALASIFVLFPDLRLAATGSPMVADVWPALPAGSSNAWSTSSLMDADPRSVFARVSVLVHAQEVEIARAAAVAQHVQRNSAEIKQKLDEERRAKRERRRAEVAKEKKLDPEWQKGREERMQRWWAYQQHQQQEMQHQQEMEQRKLEQQQQQQWEMENERQWEMMHQQRHQEMMQKEWEMQNERECAKHCDFSQL